MDLVAIQQFIITEEKSRRFFLKFRWKNYRKICPRCHGRNVVNVRRKRLLCLGCRYEFGHFTGTYLGSLRIGFRKWLLLIKVFELEASARRAAREVGISYPTALKGFHTIRRAILAQDKDSHLLKGEVEADEAYFGGRRKGKRGRGAAGKVPVFGILERAGKVTVEVVPDVRAETLLELTVKKVRRGSIVYTDKFKGYDSLMFCGFRHLKVDHGKRFARGKVYINGLEGFWSYAKERLIKFHGVSKQNFPLYLKELEFGYNHRKDKNIIQTIVNYLTTPVADLL
jgi:transposase